MFPQYGGFIFLDSEIKNRSYAYGQRNHAAAKRQCPLSDRTRPSKQLAADHHATLPTVELVNGNQISDREREIESAKQRSPTNDTKHQVHTNTGTEHEQLLQ